MVTATAWDGLGVPNTCGPNVSEEGVAVTDPDADPGASTATVAIAAATEKARFIGYLLSGCPYQRRSSHTG